VGERLFFWSSGHIKQEVYCFPLLSLTMNRWLLLCSESAAAVGEVSGTDGWCWLMMDNDADFYYFRKKGIRIVGITKNDTSKQLYCRLQYRTHHVITTAYIANINENHSHRCGNKLTYMFCFL